MSNNPTGDFGGRGDKSQLLINILSRFILTNERYFTILTGIEHLFGDKSKTTHTMLYNALGPTTDLLRYFPDHLYFDRLRQLPTWSLNKTPKRLKESTHQNITGLFTFFAEFKYTETQRPSPIKNIPTNYIGQLERESWLTHRRLSTRNPNLNIYLDTLSPRIALFYAAPFAPHKLYGGWEGDLEPIAVRKEVVEPYKRAVKNKGSGTPWINFDIRQLKPLEKFLVEDLLWEVEAAEKAIKSCKKALFGS